VSPSKAAFHAGRYRREAKGPQFVAPLSRSQLFFWGLQILQRCVIDEKWKPCG